MFRECFDRLRGSGPLIHNITNYVTVNDVANVILACGASPIMADDEGEAEEITSLCQGLNLNIGTLNSRTVEAMEKAGRRAKSLGHPIVLDPVGAGASRLRTETARRLLREVSPTVIRGNISEIRALAGESARVRGVDASFADRVTEENLKEAVLLVKELSRQTGAIIAATGAIDLVADGERCFIIRNGRPQMGLVTGTGCQLSGMTAAFLAANPDKPLEAAAAAVCAMGLAGEIAVDGLRPGEGNAACRNRIIDAICCMDGEALEKGARYELG